MLLYYLLIPEHLIIFALSCPDFFLILNHLKMSL